PRLHELPRLCAGRARHARGPAPLARGPARLPQRHARSVDVADMTDRSLLERVRREAGGVAPPEERAQRIADLISLHTGRRWGGVYGAQWSTWPGAARRRPRTDASPSTAA